MPVSRAVAFESYVCSQLHVFPVHSLHVCLYAQLQGGVTQCVSPKMSEQCFVPSASEMQGPVETCPEMGVKRNTTEGYLG